MAKRKKYRSIAADAGAERPTATAAPKPRSQPDSPLSSDAQLANAAKLMRLGSQSQRGGSVGAGAGIEDRPLSMPNIPDAHKLAMHRGTHPRYERRLNTYTGEYQTIDKSAKPLPSLTSLYGGVTGGNESRQDVVDRGNRGMAISQGKVVSPENAKYIAWLKKEPGRYERYMATAERAGQRALRRGNTTQTDTQINADFENAPLSAPAGYAGRNAADLYDEAADQATTPAEAAKLREKAEGMRQAQGSTGKPEATKNVDLSMVEKEIAKVKQTLLRPDEKDEITGESSHAAARKRLSELSGMLTHIQGGGSLTGYQDEKNDARDTQEDAAEDAASASEPLSKPQPKAKRVAAPPTGSPVQLTPQESQVAMDELMGSVVQTVRQPAPTVSTPSVEDAFIGGYSTATPPPVTAPPQPQQQVGARSNIQEALSAPTPAPPTSGNGLGGSQPLQPIAGAIPLTGNVEPSQLQHGQAYLNNNGERAVWHAGQQRFYAPMDPIWQIAPNMAQR